MNERDQKRSASVSQIGTCKPEGILRGLDKVTNSPIFATTLPFVWIAGDVCTPGWVPQSTGNPNPFDFASFGTLNIRSLTTSARPTTERAVPGKSGQHISKNLINDVHTTTDGFVSTAYDHDTRSSCDTHIWFRRVGSKKLPLPLPFHDMFNCVYVGTLRILCM